MHILITDDIYTNRMFLGIALKALGHSFDEARHGAEAIEKLKTQNFDLVLMDIEMPVKNGIETTKFIRQEFPEPQKHIPIIAITAHELSEFGNLLETAGFNAILSKPYSTERIARTIKNFFP